MSDFHTDLTDLVTKEEEPKKDPSSESSPEPEKKAEEPAPSQEEPKAKEPENSAPAKEVPFHKHPRWIRVQKELEELRAEREAAKVQKEEPKQEQTKPSSVPEEYKRLFGDDVEAFQQWLNVLDARAEAKARSVFEATLKEKEEAVKAQEEAQGKAVQYAEDQFLELAEETGIQFTDRSSSERNQVLDICMKENMFDANGLPNIALAYKFWRLSNPVKTDAVDEKKKIASKTNAKSNSASEESKVFTSSKLKKMNMSQFFN